MVETVTLENWPRLAEFFSSRGCPGYCWCLSWRDPDAHLLDGAGKAATLKGFLERGVPIGLTAIEEGETIGWCSTGPRESFSRLSRSRTMPLASSAPTWTINCLFLKKPWRGRGIAATLVEAAAVYALEQGAAEIEAYPYDTAGVSSTHQGHSRLYSACGFVPGGGRRWLRKLKGD